MLEKFYSEILDYNTSMQQNLLGQTFINSINQKREELLLTPLSIEEITESRNTDIKPFEMHSILSNIRKDIERNTSKKNLAVSTKHCQNFEKILKNLNIFSSQTLLNTLNKLQKVFNYKKNDTFEKQFEYHKYNLNLFQQKIEQDFSPKSKIIFGEQSKLRDLLTELKTALQSIIALESEEFEDKNYQNEHNLIKEIEKIHIDFGTTEIKLVYNLLNLQKEHKFHLEDEYIRAFFKNNELSSFNKLNSYVQTIECNEALELLKKDFTEIASKNSEKALNFYDNSHSRSSLNAKQLSIFNISNFSISTISCIPILSTAQEPKIIYKPSNFRNKGYHPITTKSSRV